MNRRKPYADLSRVRCVHCRTRTAQHQWSVAVCANARKRIWVAVCTPCDIAFNEHTLAFINHPDRERLMTEYRAASDDT